MKKLLNRFGSFLMSIFTVLIPVKFKRLVLVSTLYQKAAEQKIFEHVDFAKLNQGMKIASNCDVIQSAVSLKDVVWKDVDFNALIQSTHICSLNGERVDVCEANAISEQILDKIPAWLRYDKTEMSKDIMLLFCGQPIGVKA